MGRPINSRYIGNTSQSGQQFLATAYFGGDTVARTAYIAKQTATNTYNMVNVGGVQSGEVQLVNGGVALQPGQANITVTPYGASGSGATATANLAVFSATVGTGGTGPTSGYYVPGEVVSLSGGTASVTGNLAVTSVKLGNISVSAGGPGYTVGDTFTWGYAGYTTPAVATVATVTGNGNIATMTITTAGSVSNTSVSNVVPYSTSTRTNAWATNATFLTRWDVDSFAVSVRGDYSTAPTNNVATTGSAKGTGATAVVNWEVGSIKVTNGGSNYQAVNASFSGSGGAAAVGTVNAAGSVTGFTVTAAGSGYTSTAPTVSINPIANVQYASEIRNRTVTTFAGNTYEWVMSNVTMTSSNQASIRSA